MITVLFCDVVGSTAMAELFDPEEWAEVMNEAFEYLTAPISRYEGTIARLMGDGLLAFFGAPVSHEDDPERAVLAGMGIIEGIKPFREQLRLDYGMDFNVRVGINTGPVVVGDVGSAAMTEYTAMGDAVNVAARMEQTALPGTVQISIDTRRRVESLFDLEPLGAIELKGKEDPLPTFRVLGAKLEPGPLRGLPGMTAPLIGRDHEFQQLTKIMEQARQGRGQIVCIIGEAGLGKSRLLAELREEWLKHSPKHTWEFAEGIPYNSTRPYSLFQDLAKKTFGIQIDDAPDVIHEKVDQALRSAGTRDKDVELCSVAMELVIAAKVLHEAPDFPAEMVKKDLFEIAYPAFLATALTTPTVLATDDLQWADEASVELLIHLMGMVEEAPVLFLCAFRPERQSPAWKVKQFIEANFAHRYTEIVLHPLDANGTDELVTALLRITDLPDEIRALILRKTEGNPYFVEEVVRSLIELGVIQKEEGGLHWGQITELADIAIPDSLQALLMARMDRLDSEAKATLQLASVIGRSFYRRILDKTSDSTVLLDKHLSDLERVELIREQGRLPELEYIF